MLLNLVKLRYGDTPVFLDVGQIVSGYTVQSTFSARRQHLQHQRGGAGGAQQQRDPGRPGPVHRPADHHLRPALGRAIRPLVDDADSPAALLSMIQAGNPVDLVLRLAVHVVNGIYNRYGGDTRARPADPEFYVLLERLRRIQLSGAIGLRVRRVDREEAVLMTFRSKVDPSLEAEVLAARELLGLDPAGEGIQVVYGSGGRPTTRRSRFSAGRSWRSWWTCRPFIAVPEAHVADRRVLPTAEPEVGSERPDPTPHPHRELSRPPGRRLSGRALSRPLVLDRRSRHGLEAALQLPDVRLHARGDWREGRCPRADDSDTVMEARRDAGLHRPTQPSTRSTRASG